MLGKLFGWVVLRKWRTFRHISTTEQLNGLRAV